jgi:hypothetical protein
MTERSHDRGVDHAVMVGDLSDLTTYAAARPCVVPQSLRYHVYSCRL